MYPKNPKETQVIVGSMNMGYISDTDRNRILRKEISHPSLQLSKVLRVLYIFDFQWRFTTSIYLYFVPLQVKHSRLLWISRQPWETRSRRNMVMSVSGDQSHCIPFQPGSTIETKTWWKMSVSDSLHVNNLLQNRDPQSWCCKLESVVTWYMFQYTISHMSDYSWSLRKKIS